MKSDIVRKYIIPLIILSAVISNIGYCYGAPLKAVSFYEMRIGIPRNSVQVGQDRDGGENAPNMHMRLYQTNNENAPYIMLVSLYKYASLPSFVTMEDVKKMPGGEDLFLKVANASDGLFGATLSANKEMIYDTVNEIPFGRSLSVVGSLEKPYIINHLFYIYNGSLYIIVIIGNMNSEKDVLSKLFIDVAKTVLVE